MKQIQMSGVSGMVRVIVFAAMVVVLPGVSRACEFGYCWGAVATGPNGIVGYSSRLSTAPDAHARAQQACGGQCDVVEVFHDKCAAIAETYERIVFLGFGGTRTDAGVHASDKCREAKLSCVVRVEACSKSL